MGDYRDSYDEEDDDVEEGPPDPREEINYARRKELVHFSHELGDKIVANTVSDEERFFILNHLRFMVGELPTDS